jgi:hypothetical protein
MMVSRVLAPITVWLESSGSERLLSGRSIPNEEIKVTERP